MLEHQNNKPVSHAREVVLGMVFALFLLGVLFEQSRSLFTAPMPDGGRWYGDETWLMREFQTQMTEGILRNPDAPQSSISHNNGILLNSLWTNAALYGGAEILWFPTYAPVTIGRRVTWLVSLALLVYLFWMLRKWGLPAWVAISACLLFATSRAFFFGSHSARYDLWVAFGALFSLDFLLHIFRALQDKKPLGKTEKILLAAFPALCLAWNIHLVRIEFLPYAVLIAAIARTNYRAALTLLAANAVVLFLLFVPSLILITPWSLFHYGSSKSMFGETLGNNPLSRLFSFSIVWQTFRERLAGLQTEAPFALDVSGFCVAGAIVLFLGGWWRNSKMVAAWSLILFLAASFISWAVTLRYVAYYGVQILPVIIATSAILGYQVYRTIERSALRWAIASAYVCIIFITSYRSFEDAAMARERGKLITNSIQNASLEAVQLIGQKNACASTVLAGLPSQNYLLPVHGLRTINDLYREYPDRILTFPEFLKIEHVNYILDAPRAAVFRELAGNQPVDSLLVRAPKFYGPFDDAGFDYFNDTPLREDTLALYAIPQ